jgi:hypothetical protein
VTGLILSLIRTCLPLLILLAMCLSSSATAQSLSDRIDIHGYGFQDYLQTKGDPYLGGDSRGIWDNNSMATSRPVTIARRKTPERCHLGGARRVQRIGFIGRAPMHRPHIAAIQDLQSRRAEQFE